MHQRENKFLFSNQIVFIHAWLKTKSLGDFLSFENEI